MFRKYVILLCLAFFGLACGASTGEILSRIPGVEVDPLPTTEVSVAGAASIQVTPLLPTVDPQAPPTATPLPTATPVPTITPIPTQTPTPSPFLYGFRTEPRSGIAPLALPRHGLIIALILPLLFFGIPWIILEWFTARHVQPRSIDLTGIRIKAQDGLFIRAVVSMTARRNVRLVSFITRWNRVKEVVEKAIEQELIDRALNYASLPELESNLKQIIEGFATLEVLEELRRDFGVEVLRFNIEIRYPTQTIDAINRTAEASAGGQAYIAYARAAHLDPDTAEARQLYGIYQETTSQVDAARGIGGGIAAVTQFLRGGQEEEVDDSDVD